MSSIPAHLLTPRDWQAEAAAHAARECGTPEGRRALAEAARYGALADRLAELQAEIERITEAGRAHIRRAAAFETQRDELAVKLAAMRLAIATKEAPREAECRRQRERDQELKAAHAARMAAHAAAQESAR